VSTPQLAPRHARHLPLRTLGAVSASAIALPLFASSAQAATIPFPRPSRTLPRALDVAPPYQKGTRCLTVNQPGPVAFAKLLNSTYGSHVYGILRTCAAEHGEGRALDWMIDSRKPANMALANALTRWLAAPDAQGRPGAMARRFGINYIIFNRQQWRAWAPERGWAVYTGVSPHTDHIHFSFNWDGAYKRTSWWSGVAVTKPLTGPTSTITPPASAPLTASGYPLLVQGASGATVALAQKVVGATADGRFGAATATALGTWQSRHRVPATKRLDNPTWATMVYLRLVPARTSPLSPYTSTVLRRGSSGAAVKALQKAIGKLVVDGSFGQATETRVKAYQSSKGLPATGVVDRRVWFALMGAVVAPAPATPAANPLARYAGLTLRLWSTGEAVKALQKAIGGLAVDGSYGRLTEARVRAFQKAKGLPVTGVTDARVWKALMTAPSAPAPAPAAALATEFTPVKGTTLRAGSTGAAVKVLQRALGGLVVDGRYGSATTVRVKAFQTAHRLPATGVVEARTWAALELAAHPLLPYWGKVLKRGSTGAPVVALQRALRISADGQFGPATEAAVKTLQRTAKLAVTGVVGTVTWKAVEARMPR
jgi:peptidoglycan hydrolase-like protein with peptidoglycan-binding domain